MGYDWNGTRVRWMKALRLGTVVALAAVLISVATQVVSNAL
ncbi:hypothetical protein SAMN05216328_12216 [Ensifer sp. YR511]|jgi:hypothetical protein|nr:hypothetical protein SAMN05216328_12216 [Ensifer sp. YR511]